MKKLRWNADKSKSPELHNQKSVLDEQTATPTQVFCMCISFPINNLCLFHFLKGNLLAILVLAQPEMKGSFNQLLLSLSLYDLIYLIMSLLLFAIPQLSDTYKEVIYPWIFIFLYVSCT